MVDAVNMVSAAATRPRSQARPVRASGSSCAGWRQIGGQRRFYRSKWEANYARYLEWLRTHGQVLSWDHEPDVFWFNQPRTVQGRRLLGVKRGVVSYLPDFKVIERSGVIRYHEVKGWMDDRSKTKISRMRRYYPEFPLVVIDKRVYASIAKQVGAMISGWE